MKYGILSFFYPLLGLDGMGWKRRGLLLCLGSSLLYFNWGLGVCGDVYLN